MTLSPLYEGRRPERPIKKRALLVSPCFPPGAMAGALRWQRLSKFAAERGLALDVITLASESQDRVERERLEELPAGIRVYGVSYDPSPVLRGLHTLLSQFRRMMIPGAHAFAAVGRAPAAGRRGRTFTEVREVVAEEWTDRRWIRAVSRLGYALTRDVTYSAVISCGPPHMAHVAAALVARQARLPLIIDLRDPWGQVAIQRAHIPLWLVLARHYEAKVVADAALIVMNTETARDAMRAAYPAVAERIIAVMNGCDDEEIPSVEPGGCFKIIYAGSIYLDRDPSSLFEAVARVVQTEKLTSEDLTIEFIGHASVFRGVPLKSIAERFGLSAHLIVCPPCPRTELFKRLSGAALLVSLPQGTHMCIPSKIFEYMQFPAWLLALAQNGSATATLLTGTTADVVDPRDIGAIEEVVRRRYSEYQGGIRAIPVARTSLQLSRRVQSDIFFAALGRCTDRMEVAEPSLLGVEAENIESQK